MGWFSSDEIVKTGETTGNIANNILLKNETTNRVEILLLIIAIIKLVEFIYFIYSGYVRRLKKRCYNNTAGARNRKMAWTRDGAAKSKNDATMNGCSVFAHMVL